MNGKAISLSPPTYTTNLSQARFVGQYYIAPQKAMCDAKEIQYLSISYILNITFVKIPQSIWHMYTLGYYHQGFWKHSYMYADTNKLFRFQYQGSNAIYCNFKEWSENTDLDMWVSPFAPEV